MNFLDFKSQWGLLHGGASTAGIVGGWLSISYRAARTCSWLRITPNLLTSSGIACAIAAAWSSPHSYAALFLALSLFFDGIDGSLAIYQEITSRKGAIWDGIADRISEFFWAFALYRLGVPVAWVLALVALASFQEYARARVVGAGVKEVGVVTPAERPVRASFLFCALLAPITWATTFAIALTVLQGVSFFLVLRFAYQRLHSQQSPH
ncbi:MAG: CDP-alcohol phosphatidyltransferase family protein [Actinobacteria bacterium]|nr:CDP-alcohol phosphatidyltransferase family protein [Actinomycetota bacterium]